MHSISLDFLPGYAGIERAFESHSQHNHDSPDPNSKKSAFFARLREVAAEKPYLSFDRLKQVAAGRQIENIDTLKGYLGEAVDAGLLHRAGRGWYSSLSRPARMPWDAGNPLPEILAERFPLLPHFVWSTQQVNPWMHHLLGRFVNFVYVDADGAEDVREFLESQA